MFEGQSNVNLRLILDVTELCGFEVPGNIAVKIVGVVCSGVENVVCVCESCVADECAASTIRDTSARSSQVAGVCCTVGSRDRPGGLPERRVGRREVVGMGVW